MTIKITIDIDPDADSPTATFAVEWRGGSLRESWRYDGTHVLNHPLVVDRYIVDLHAHNLSIDDDAYGTHHIPREAGSSCSEALADHLFDHLHTLSALIAKTDITNTQRMSDG